MENHELEMQQQGDSYADAFTAVVLVCIFVAACTFWVSGQ